MFMSWAVGFAAVLAWLVQLRGPRAAIKTPLHRIGVFSYSLYAVHMPVITLANAVLLQGAPSQNLRWALAIAALVGLASFAVYLCAERPSIRLLAKLPR